MCEIKGKIKLIKPEQVISDKFKKREFVVTTEGEYPQHVALELTQDKCGLIDKYQVGQDVTVSINVRGREWTSPQGEVKYFNTLQAWRIESSQSAPTATAPVESDGDDLPFN